MLNPFYKVEVIVENNGIGYRIFTTASTMVQS